jgi:hypothetical protein
VFDKLIEGLLSFFYQLGIETRAKEHVDRAVIEYKEKIKDKGNIVAIVPEVESTPPPPIPEGVSEGVKALWGTTGIQATGKLIIKRQGDQKNE